MEFRKTDNPKVFTIWYMGEHVGNLRQRTLIDSNQIGYTAAIFTNDGAGLKFEGDFELTPVDAFLAAMKSGKPVETPEDYYFRAFLNEQMEDN